MRSLLPAVAVLAALRIFFVFYHAYQPVSPNLVPPLEGVADAGPAPGLHAGPWTAGGGALAGRETASDGRSTRFVLRAEGARRGEWAFTLSGWGPGVDAFLVEARCRAEGIRAGGERSQLGRVNFFYRDAEGRAHWEQIHVACMLEGTRAWDNERRFFPVPGYARTAHLVLANQGVSGVFAVESLSVRALRMNAANRFWFPAWGAAWGLAAWAYLRRLRPGRRRGGWLVLGTGALIVAGMLIPEGWIESVHVAADHALVALASPPPPAPPAAGPASATPAARPTGPAAAPAPTAAPAGAVRIRAGDVNHAGHLTLFALLGWSVARVYRRRGAGAESPAAWPAMLAGLTVFAFAAEQLQWLTLTRCPRLADIGLNLVGLAAGLLVFGVGARLVRRVAA